MVVTPGDIICGDLDGLVSVPSGSAMQIAAQVENLKRKEQASLKAIEAGTLDRAWVDEVIRANRP
jgi:regulator of RNase E activity RraA